jgi:arylsulfatase A-like enzyme
MSATFSGKSVERSKALFWEYGRNPKSYAYPSSGDRSPAIAVRDGKWKLLINPDGSRTELYDLQTDPVESRNVEEEQPEITKRLSGSALDWFQARPTLPVDKTAKPAREDGVNAPD